MIFNGGLYFITSPLRALARVFRRSRAVGKVKSASGMGSAGEASAKGAGSLLAKTASPEELFIQEYKEERPTGVETILFRQLPRPRLTERTASDLTLEQAQQYSEEASRFYDFNFALFAGGELFYEEVEEQFLIGALGAHEDSIDKRFVDVMNTFRQAINDNTRRLIFYWMPALLVAGLISGVLLASGAFGADYFTLAGFAGSSLHEATAMAVGVALALLVLLVIVVWPYKVVQQRNLMNLDNYITSKFARINNNFQVAKRRALNVERDKRMHERDELKQEAGVWTLAYQWFAMRLFLCELMIRNKFYQVRRNTALYWAIGLAFAALLGAGLIVGAAAGGFIKTGVVSTAFAAGAAYIVFAGALLRGIAPMMLRIIQANEWSRFHLINLHKTVADHVGEDKVQIVTFRDRNRME